MRHLIIVAMGFASPAWAATWRVGVSGDFSPGATPAATITAALTAAAPGDVIEIGDGTYNEALTVAKSVTLRGVGTLVPPTLLTTSLSPALLVNNGASPTFEALTWTSGAGRRCARVAGGADATFVDVTFSNCAHNGSGAALHVAAGSSATAVRASFLSTIDPITVPDAGGGFIWAQGDVTLRGSVLEGGRAARGGAVLVEGTLTVRPDVVGPITVTTDFLDNAAERDGALEPCGGAICVLSGAVDLQQAYFADNRSDADGGHVGLLGGALVDAGSAWLRGIAVRGGALSGAGTANATLTDTTARDGDADEGAGVAWLSSGTLTWTNGALRGGDATRGGAAAVRAGRFVAHGVEFVGNTAVSGGAVYADGAQELVLTACAVTDNAATNAGVGGRHGGGLAVTGVTTTSLTALTLDGNTATDDGGGLWWSPTSPAQQLLLQASTVSGNAAATGGGVALAAAGDARVSLSRIVDNSAGVGGGLSAVGGALTVTGSAINGNVSAGDGGGVWLSGVTAALRATLLHDNRGGQGAAVRILGGACELRHVTVLGTVVLAPATRAAVAASSASLTLVDSAITHTAVGRGAAAITPISTVAHHLLLWSNAGGNLQGFTATPSFTVAPAYAAFTNDGAWANDAPWPAWVSPLRDQASGGVDPDGSPADLGAFGGPDAAGTTPWVRDADADGTVAGADCDDADPARFVGAVEGPADGVDADCDRQEACYLDADGDGAGAAALGESPTLSCVAPGFAPAADDCDDADPDERPGALWYVDADGDGVGAALAGVCARRSPSDVPVDGDCDDADPDVAPGAPEVPGDGVDQDCDGLERCFTDADADGFGGAAIDVADPSCTGAGRSAVPGDCDDADAAERPGVVWYRDADGDGYGAAGSPGRACDRAAPSDRTNDDDCNDANQAVRPGVPERPTDGVDQDCDGQELCRVDVDGDGFGRTTQVTSAILSCVGPGVANNRDDCDDDPSNDTLADQAALKYPGAVHYRDADADGYGAPGADRVECNLSAGYSVLATDCDDDASDDTEGDRAARVFPGATYYGDGDGDGHGRPDAPVTPPACGLPAGHAVWGDDCDDADPAVYAGAVFFPDVDGDGYGDDARPLAQPGVCTAPPGYVSRGGDCDDDPADDPPSTPAGAVYPGATYYRDRDGDGFGGATTFANPAICAPPAGYVARPGDCDDDPAHVTPGREAAGIYPGATYYTDLDGDGWGQDASPVTPPTCGRPAGTSTRSGDCDDLTADDAFPGEAFAIHPDATYFADVDGDGFGAAPSTPGACEVPPGFAARAGDCDDDPSDDTLTREAGRIYPGATYWLDEDGDGWGGAVPFSNPAVCAVPPGFSTAGDDCDDDDGDDRPGAEAANIHPLATYYLDRDGDGHGDASLPVSPPTCGLPAGASTLDDDCDDDDSDDRPGFEAALIHPGAAMFVDDDGDTWGLLPTTLVGCAVDGLVTRGDDCVDDPRGDTPARRAADLYPGAPYHRDQDRDGWGAGAPLGIPGVCLPPAGYVANDDDCDDDARDDTRGRQAALVYPGAPYYLDVDGDGVGAGPPAVGACEPGPGYVVLGTDCDDDPTDDAPGRAAAGVYPGATYYADDDGDGYGRQPLPPAGCALPAGASTRGDDCDDDASDDLLPLDVAALLYPGSPRFLDADGDGWGAGAPLPADPAACELSPGTTVTAGDCDDDPADDRWPGYAAAVQPGGTWYPDVDLDGHGADVDPQSFADCAPVPGRSPLPDDCDDDPADDAFGAEAHRVFPGAAYFLDVDGDAFGGARVASPCALPPGASTWGDDCDDDPADDTPGLVAALIYPGATWFPDADADTWGDDALAVSPPGCAVLAGHVVRGGDCLDAPDGGVPGVAPDRVFPGSTWWPDRDGDTWGDDAGAVSPPGCAVLAAHVTRGGDCDDDPSDDTPGQRAALLHPGATCFADDDGDRWGDDLQPVAACADACATRGGDCDDARADVAPDAAEIPGNGVDENCDGGEACFTDRDGDGFGGPTLAPDDGDGDCRSPGEAAVGGDCDDDPSDDAPGAPAVLTYPGAPERCGDGVDANCSCAEGLPDFPGMVGCGEGAGDEDGDGLTWVQETALGLDDCHDDVDGDGVPDGEELGWGTDPSNPDSDDDGVPDGVELAGGGPNTDCAPSMPPGTLCDALIDALDDDDDGDGIPTADEGQGDRDCADPANGDYRLAPDGVPDHLDPDADGDGLPDLVEGMGDGDGDGLPDAWDCEVGDDSLDPDCDGLSNGVERGLPQGPLDPDAADSDGDGVLDGAEAGDPSAPRDSDGDGTPDALDPDDDGDGVPTADELRLTCPDGGALTPAPACHDGAFAWTCDDGAEPVPANLDAPGDHPAWPREPDLTPDWLDDDDDGDGVPTVDEGVDADLDGDGAVDAYDPDDYDGPDGDGDGDGLSNGDEAAAGTDPHHPDTDRDGRPDGVDGLDDLDEDDIPGALDPDDDGDGVPTALESDADPDRDGSPAWRDPDADGDGVPDGQEAGDSDCDGVPDALDADDADGPCVAGLDEGGTTPIVDEDVRACGGCGSAGATSGAWVALLALAAARRRRRGAT